MASILSRQCARVFSSRRLTSIPNTFKSTNITRPITTTRKLYKEDKRTPNAEHEGTFARTDRDVRVEYPEEHELPRSAPVQGRGGMHFKRTLASFSLDGNVGVVTGGARGLGLVMSQALVLSGADVAIVDLNSTNSHLEQRVRANYCRGRRRTPGQGADEPLPRREPWLRAVRPITAMIPTLLTVSAVQKLPLTTPMYPIPIPSTHLLKRLSETMGR